MSSSCPLVFYVKGRGWLLRRLNYQGKRYCSFVTNAVAVPAMRFAASKVRLIIRVEFLTRRVLPDSDTAPGAVLCLVPILGTIGRGGVVKCNKQGRAKGVGR